MKNKTKLTTKTFHRQAEEWLSLRQVTQKNLEIKLRESFNAGVHAAALAAYEVMRPGDFSVNAVTDAIHALKVEP